MGLSFLIGIRAGGGRVRKKFAFVGEGALYR